MHKNRILCYFLLYDIEIEGGKNVFLQITTHHSRDTSFASPSLKERSLLVSPHPALYRAAGRSAQGSHYTYKTAPVKEDLHVVSSFLSFGDEVAKTEESTVLMCL